MWVMGYGLWEVYIYENIENELLFFTSQVCGVWGMGCGVWDMGYGIQGFGVWGMRGLHLREHQE